MFVTSAPTTPPLLAIVLFNSKLLINYSRNFDFCFLPNNVIFAIYYRIFILFCFNYNFGIGSIYGLHAFSIYSFREID